jgi:hypothetical protein
MHWEGNEINERQAYVRIRRISISTTISVYNVTEGIPEPTKKERKVSFDAVDTFS